MIHTLFFHFRTLMFVGILTNLSVCWVVVRNSQARTARNLFIINMAFSDLTVCCITMPATVMKLINHTWKYGDLLCRLTRYILFIYNFRVMEFHPLYKTQKIKYWKNRHTGDPRISRFHNLWSPLFRDSVSGLISWFWRKW